MPGPTAADLIFSEQANHNFSRTLGDLKRSTLSIHNRLTSILEDATFAQNVAEAYGRPLIANERCGSWYIDPARKGGSAYFKSTDGHTGVWKFSSRRLNLHLLEVIGKNDGCIVIDSTRRGKRMPDALSKTIPIWCAVLNQFLFPDEAQYHDLYTPPQVLSDSEKAQMTALLPSFVAALKTLQIAPESTRNYISKPLRPFWVTPETDLGATSTIFDRFHPVICCTVSRRISGGEASEGGYIQGAGDDTENWAYGLTPTVFWGNRTRLLNTPESDLPALIDTLLLQEKGTKGAATELRLVVPTSQLFISKLPVDLPAANEPEIDTITIMLCSDTKVDEDITARNRLKVGLGAHKVGAKRLRLLLPRIIDFVEKCLYHAAHQPHDTTISDDFTTAEGTSAVASASECLGASSQVARPTISLSPCPGSSSKDTQDRIHLVSRIIVACETGSQTSIGAALAIACLFFDDNGGLLPSDSKRRSFNKDFIRSRLAWFSTSMPDANPSRDVLQSVNSFLMDYQPSR